MNESIVPIHETPGTIRPNPLDSFVRLASGILLNMKEIVYIGPLSNIAPDKHGMFCYMTRNNLVVNLPKADVEELSLLIPQ